MKTCIAAAFGHTRTVVLVLVLLVLSGMAAYLHIPKESAPDVAIPIINVSMTHEGISPEDAERLLLRPMERTLQSIAGLKEMRATAREGSAAITLEFDAGFDSDQALQEVREKVDMAKVELPPETDEPAVNEVNVALFPVLTVILSGDVPERTLVRLARDLEDKIEAVPGVLAVEIAGDREEVMEVIVDPLLLESYNLSMADLFRFVQNNNRLVAAGALDTGAGRFVIKVPGVIEDATDVFNLPIKVDGNTVVTFKDIAVVRPTFKDPTSFARVNGHQAVALEVSKRIGANIIDTIAQVRTIVEAEHDNWPASVTVTYTQDRSKNIRTMLGDLQNNVLSAIFLVMIVIIAAMGVRSALLVGIAIPGSFLAGILVIFALGFTINVVVLFSLILVVGMLVDGAIVVVEFADRQMAEGLPRHTAYQLAAVRMAWPIIASTATTLAVFLPLLFWPGVVGDFMKYLPITVLATLTVALVMALLFVPVLGALLGTAAPSVGQHARRPASAKTDGLETTGSLTRVYLRVLRLLIRHPANVLLAAFLFLVAAYAAYAVFGQGVEFFPEIEPERAQLQVRSRDDLSVWEQDALLRQVESRLLDMPAFASVYARSGNNSQNRRAEFGEDVIGVIQLEFVDWRQRRPAVEILAEIQQRTASLAGIIIETRKQRSGPSSGKPIQLAIRARDPKLLAPVVAQLRTSLQHMSGLVDVEDSRPLPGIEWRLQVNRAEAAHYGADVALLGNAVQMVTNGIKVGDYRPADTDQEVDIRVRFPFSARTFDQLDRLRVPTRNALVPISNFVTLVPAPKGGTIRHTDGQRVMTVQADVAPGILVADKVREIRQWLAHAKLDSRITVQFKGQDEEQREARQFLTKAFVGALFLMAILLVTQFNSFYQASLILSAVVFSTAGVLLGLLVTGQPFGIVMGGIGIIALAGIVVNNNIVLIDTYNDLRTQGLPPHEAILHTGAQRLRPVLLTTLTTILGLLPMMFGVNIDFLTREVTVGAPSTQWWTQLASAVAGGLTFATLLTLLLTPCLLILGANATRWWVRRHDRRNVQTGTSNPKTVRTTTTPSEPSDNGIDRRNGSSVHGHEDVRIRLR